MRVHCLYIAPWSLNDPLCESQALSYIKRLVSNGYSFALMTLENEKFSVSNESERTLKEDLAANNIFWYPVKWKAGNSMSEKILGIILVIFRGIRIFFRHRPQLIHSRSSLPAFMAVVLARLFRVKYLYDADSVLSEEYADSLHLSRESRAFKFLAWSESWARRNADYVVVLTEVLKEDFEEKYGVRSPIEVIPCCVDTELFCPDESLRKDRRTQLGLTDEKLLIYVGKIGVRYQLGRVFEFFKLAASKINIKLLIVSLDDSNAFDEIANGYEIARKSYIVKTGDRDAVREWLMASDAGIAFIKESVAERGSSPIKISEYLSAGLPVILTNGIGDCSRIVFENNAGVVLNGVSDQKMRTAVRQLDEIWKQERSAVLMRCRETAEENFSLNSIGHPRYQEIYRRLLDARD